MPDRFRVLVMPQASSDLQLAFDYIQENSPQNASAVIEKLFKAVDSLAMFPHRYKMHRSTSDANRVIRSMPVSPFVIYYRIIESDRLVEILTVRHGARKKPRSFN